MKFIVAIFLSGLVWMPGLSQSTNWYQGERSDESPSNIGTDQVYDEVLKDRKSQTVVVAVIDSGVDIEHEDLQEVIWVNHDEVPDNGVDDDQNGYVDDVNGWNFIGGPNGQQVDGDTFEMTRLYAAYRKKFTDRDPSTLNKDEKEEYEEYVKYGKRIKKEIKKAQDNYNEIKPQFDVFDRVLRHIERIEKEMPLNKALADSLSTLFNSNDAITANILNYYLSETGSIPKAEKMREELVDPLEEGLKHYGYKFKYNWNPDYNPRYLVGDNYADVHEKYYGNPLVEGPDAYHGTHVAGIIAARRNNGVGINGVSDNVRIMVLRAVPDGDERDKDIANAIRYAVDNGASIINMSFGKGASPHKEIVDDAIRHAEKNDVLVVHAAGNSSNNLAENDNYPNDRFAKPKGFLFFRKKYAKNYISVGASAPSKGANMVADFSNYGADEVDLFAPGVMMYSTVPNNKYSIAQGTSMAAPVISGVAAIIRSYFPTLTAVQVKEAIMKSTAPINTMVKKPGSGELVPFTELSVSGGIVDISAAVELASGMKGKKKIKSRKDQEIRP